MFDPENFEAILNLDDTDLLNLPTEEDDRCEFKSSMTKDDDLGKKICKAASGFWNSGGGLFVIGVNDHGQPDGGISLKIGNQSRKDWIDKVLIKVEPRASYEVQCIKNDKAGLNIGNEKAVILIGFASSQHGPHMFDNRYYLRAGAHTVPASQFLVDAIYARRAFCSPLLRHVIRQKPEDVNTLQIGIVCLNDSPALNVEITLNPFPPSLKQWEINFPLVVPVISKESHFFFDFDRLNFSQKPDKIFCLQVKYNDLANHEYHAQFTIDEGKQLGPNFGAHGEKDQQLHKIAVAIDMLTYEISEKKI